jgi:hypothetical protein
LHEHSVNCTRGFPDVTNVGRQIVYNLKADRSVRAAGGCPENNKSRIPGSLRVIGYPQRIRLPVIVGSDPFMTEMILNTERMLSKK